MILETLAGLVEHEFNENGREEDGKARQTSVLSIGVDTGRKRDHNLLEA